tara:strand:+ start:1517 stop:2212 length:696 start_codon:yes stop_codon:yes gene_type:complete
MNKTTLKYLLCSLFLGDTFNQEQYTVLKDFYNTHFFGRPLRTMLKTGDKVLELGCGKDSLINRSGQIRELRVTGVDIFKPYVDEHNKRGLYTACLVADITKIEFELNQFDAVLCMDVLEHLNRVDGAKLLERMKIWGKKVIITTPNGRVPGIPSDDRNIYQEHQSGWTAKELESRGYTVRGASGWKLLRKPDSQLRYLHPFVFWAGVALLSSLIVYYLPNKAFHLQAMYES